MNMMNKKPSNGPTETHDNEMVARVADLWKELETHYQYTIDEPEILQRLHQMDADACDGTLTEARFNRISKALLSLPKSYKVDHATGGVPRQFYDNVDPKTGKTLLATRKVIHKRKTKWDRKKYSSKRLQDLDTDVAAETKRIDGVVRRMLVSGDNRDENEQRILDEAHQAAAQRKERIRQVMAENPEMSPSAIMRLPEFDHWSAPVAPKSLRT